ncbi:MAG: sigma-70 family RNA polymerase sigma factor [Verrucomicrobia bacterium]|nr:sigma-70 family RNA polymerase sigma factor [Verrucomicrobiota bacterium]
MMTDDGELVRTFARSGSEEAFAALVARHVNLVYSVALRQVRDPHQAEEITQTVFLILARKAGSLGPHTVVSAWLCRTARYVSARALTMQRRRQARELEVFMQSPQNDPAPSDAVADDWKQIEPLLDAAMSRLSEADHNAVVLRFLEGRSFREVSVAMGVSESAAKMRVNRALGKLRTILARRGIALSAAAIGVAVSTHSVQAAPIGLAAATSLTVAGSAAVPSTLSPLFHLTLKSMAWTKLKTVVVAGTVLLMAAGTTTVLLRDTEPPDRKASPQNGFVGFATPEAAIQSMLWAGSQGDFDGYLKGCTAAQAERMRNKMAGKSEAEVSATAKVWAQAMSGYHIDQKEIVSDTEVQLHISAPPAEEGLRNGRVVVIFRKEGDLWKQAGDR